VYLLVFQAHINEIHGQEAKSSVKKIVRQRCAEEFNSAVKGLILNANVCPRFKAGESLTIFFPRPYFYCSIILERLWNSLDRVHGPASKGCFH
jgi:hypothetical protein